MAYSIGNVSGCHINPAVSLGMALSGRMKWREFWGYVIAQVLGGIAGAAILGVLVRSFANLGANGYDGTHVTVWIALLVEIILTFIFVLVVLGVTDKRENGVTSVYINDELIESKTISHKSSFKVGFFINRSRTQYYKNIQLKQL